MNVEAVLERLRDAYRVPDMASLAARLGMDETTFRVWRTRKTVPPKVLVKVSHDTGRSVSWLSEAALTQEDAKAHEPTALFFNDQTKQINLTSEELALLDNFRAASAEGRLAIAAASAALAKPVLKRRKTA